MSQYQLESLSELVSTINTITNEVKANFGKLSAQQLNWKPSVNEWGVAQCFDHLVTTNATYFPIFELVKNGEKKSTLWESIPWLPALWGKLLIHQLGPVYTRKMKAPKVFRPSSSAIDEDMVQRFIDQQNQLVTYIKAIENLDAEKTIITSPASKIVTYSVMDAYRIIVVHEQRHILQAKRVKDSEGFSE